MPIATLTLVALDCPDPVALATFYQGIVGGEFTSDPEAPDWIRLNVGTGCDLGFQRDENYRPPEWPSGLPQQLHLDFDVTDLAAGEAQVLALGARKAEFQHSPEEWLVFLDPVGHPFCLIKR